MQELSTCCLCNQISGQRQNDLISCLLKEERYVRRVALETENFAVIPSLGPLARGHSLLCPKQHLKGLRDVGHEHDTEYLQVKRQVTRILQSVYGAPVHCFEHGVGGSDAKTLCSTEHAHLHLVPVRAEVWKRLAGEFHWIEVGPGLNDLKSHVGSGEYLYYESPDHRGFAAKSSGGRMESQYLRRVFAEVLGMPDHWNWKEIPSPEEADAAFRAIRAALSLEGALQ